MVTLPPITLTGNAQTVNLPASLPGGTDVRIANESAYALQIGLGPETHWLDPWTVDLFRPVGATTSVSIAPTILTVSALVSPSSVVLITLADPGERIPGRYPISLNRQSATFQQQLALAPTGPLAVSFTGDFIRALPPGTQAVAISSSQADAGSIFQIIVTGVQSGLRYATLSPLSPDPWPFYIPIRALDTSLDFNVTLRVGASVANIFFDALLATTAQIVIPGRIPWGVSLTDNSGGAIAVDTDGLGNESLDVSNWKAHAAAWQSPNQVPAPINVNMNAGGLTNIIPAMAGNYVYLFYLNYSISLAGGVAGQFQTTAGGVIDIETFQNGAPRSRAYAGARLPLGVGVDWNTTAAGNTFLVGGAAWSRSAI